MSPESTPFPGGLSELEFVDAYLNGALRKPQVTCDSLLRALVMSNTVDRLMLTGLMAEQLAEACRRLVAVVNALGDRRYPIARTLLAPLPGLDEWQRFIQQAGTFSPEQMVRELSLSQDVVPQAEQLRSQLDLDMLSPLVAASSTGTMMLLMPPGPARVAWVAGIDGAGKPVASIVGEDEREAASLADMTADLVSIAHSFLADYLNSRQTAGRR